MYILEELNDGIVRETYMKIADGLAKKPSQAKISMKDMHNNEVPDIYSLDITQWRLVNRYLDETFQWIALVDGRRLRTRTFKQDWEKYIPLDFKLRAKGETDFSFTKHITMTRVLSADHHCKHRMGTLRLWCEGKVAFIEHSVHGQISLMTCTVNTPDLLDALIDVLRKYQVACRYYSRQHDLNIKALFQSIERFMKLTRELSDLKQVS